MKKLTVEQRIHRLDKRVAIFEQVLALQVVYLSQLTLVPLSAKQLMERLVFYDLQAKMIMSQIMMINSQPMPKFKSGGFNSHGIKDSGKEYIINSNGKIRCAL